MGQNRDKSYSEETRSVNNNEQEELKKKALKRLKETLVSLDQWKRDSLASPIRY